MRTKTTDVYTFKGTWFDIFDKLSGLITPENIQKFAIWESRSKNNEHLLVVYKFRLTDMFQRKSNLNEIDKPEFYSNLRTRMRNLKIHRYNEFHKINRRTFLYSISSKN